MSKWKSLTPEFQELVMTTEMVWNISEPLIDMIVSNFQSIINNNIFSPYAILDLFDCISSKSLKNLLPYVKLVSSFLKSQNLLKIEYPFSQNPALQAALIKSDVISGEIPEEYTNMSLEDIYKIYPKDSLKNIIFYDDIEKFKGLQDLDIMIDETYSLIDYCARCGAVKCFDYLLEKGQKFTDETMENAFIGNNTEIIHKCETKCFVSTRCLMNCIENHHNITAKYVQEKYALDFPWESTLMYYNFQSFFAKLSSSKTIDDRDQYGKTALMAACEYGFFPIVSFLVENGSEVNLKDERGCSPLTFAAANNRPEIVTFLLSKGADIESKTKIGFTPLIIASQQNSIESIVVLFNNEVNLNNTDETGATALMIAIQEGSSDVIQFLVENGCDLNIQDSNGNSALILAANYGNAGVVQYLVENGAKKDLANGKGFTAMQIAHELGFTDIEEILN